MPEFHSARQKAKSHEVGVRSLPSKLASNDGRREGVSGVSGVRELLHLLSLAPEVTQTQGTDKGTIRVALEFSKARQ